jgi:hypothetical protein
MKISSISFRLLLTCWLGLSVGSAAGPTGSYLGTGLGEPASTHPALPTSGVETLDPRSPHLAIPLPSGSVEQTLQPSRAEVDGTALRISVPPTWRRVQEGRSVMFAPEDGHGQLAGKAHVVYGIELGVKGNTRRDPSGAFDDVVQAFKSTNPALRSVSITRLVTLAGHLGLRGTFSNTSPVTGHPEFVVVATAPVERDRVLYVIAVAPQEQFLAFRPTAEAILLSIEEIR